MKTKKITKKLVSFLLITCMIIVFAIPSSAETLESQVLYEVAEINDKEIIIERAKNEVDELKANTGYEIVLQNDRTANNAVTYKTTQLLKSEIIDGKQIDTYVGTVLSTYNTYESMSATRLSVTLTSRIYFTYDNSVGRVQMRYTTATLSGSGASRLVMTNGLKTSGIADYVSTTSQYSNPSGTYTLNRCSSAWVSEATGFLHVNDRLYFDDGTYCQNNYHINRWGENLY